MANIKKKSYYCTMLRSCTHVMKMIILGLQKKLQRL